jgi:hypothetical protein
MNYQTIFQIGLRSFPWSQILLPAFFVVVGLLLVRFSRGKRVRQIIGVGAAVFGTLGVIILSTVIVPKFFEHRRAYVNGDSAVVQGVVEDFRPMPALGAAEESFSVHGVFFSYSVLDATPCFRNAPLTKGPFEKVQTFESTIRTDAFSG